ncbi:nuclear transport factor 2 family protein [Mucilaginibacter sabulilitoris]|uniref:Nuclear transport factor 2 family protein n=1 Tax=Mucilaginibacter sabulilitoris TaxID=1173583 RepID=A0ABZ0TPJ3_9SPHI|nr:nuclear transport factor 2 family protein [Mucilaginibacter sabulilitoris]WPU95023.1 nuclear transport factor 2 family protein [Mucilaginibacter sabulilitoris]
MNTSDEAQLQIFIHERVEAICNKDIAGATNRYAQDVMLFDVVGPLQQSGIKAMQERLNTWFASFDGNIGFEIKDLNIVLGGDAGFCYSFNHVSAKTKDGGNLNMWWRETLGWQKINGEWLVTHAHSSVPFDAVSGKGAIGLKP